MLVRTKYFTQAKMLVHFQCPKDPILEAIKPYRTLSYSKGGMYNYGLYKFSEKDIPWACPTDFQSEGGSQGHWMPISRSQFSRSKFKR